jgi:hypothetical protein
MTEAAALLDTFTTPPKVARTNANMQRLRMKYAQELTVQYGIPPAIAKTLVYTYKSPKAFHPAAQMWTGKCALSGIKLTDRGDHPTSTIIQHKRKRFISKFIHDAMVALDMPEGAFIKMCSAVYTAQYGHISNTPYTPSAVQQSSMGVHYSEHQSAGNTGDSIGAANPIDTKRANILGLHTK